MLIWQLFIIISVCASKTNYDTLLNDIQSVIMQTSDNDLLKYIFSILTLLEQALVYDFRELLNQSVGRVIISPFDSDQLFVIDQVKQLCFNN